MRPDLLDYLIFCGGGSNEPPTVLQNWYNSLSVKPSAGLWSDLKTMADGMDSDGDWDEMDFMAMLACMETDEQRLRPLKTSSGDDMVVVGNPIFSSEGVLSPVNGNLNYINSKWNAVDNGVKFKLDDAFMGVYGDNNAIGSASKYIFGGSYNDLSSAAHLFVSSTTTSISNGTQSILNTNTGVTSVSKTGLVSGRKRFFVTNTRTSSNSVTKYINGLSGISSNVSTFINNFDMAICGVNYENTIFDTWNAYIRCAMLGSSSISSSRVQARLQTFFTARGLTITNF